MCAYVNLQHSIYFYRTDKDAIKGVTKICKTIFGWQFIIINF